MEEFVFEKLSAEEKKHVKNVDKYLKMFREKSRLRNTKDQSAAGASTTDYGDPDEEYFADTTKYNARTTPVGIGGRVTIIDVMDGQDPDAAYEELERQFLIDSASMMYKSDKHTGPEEERKICIWPGGYPVSWTVLSSGYSWVGVNGSDATCVVSICEPTRKRPASKIEVGPHNVLRAALADMIGDTPFSFRHHIPQSSHDGPIAVVSVAPCAPGQKFTQAPLALQFLKKKLEDCSFLSSEDTEQIAICALKLLLGRKFNANKIVIHGWEKGKGPWHTGQISKRRVLHAISKQESPGA